MKIKFKIRKNGHLRNRFSDGIVAEWNMYGETSRLLRKKRNFLRRHVIVSNEYISGFSKLNGVVQRGFWRFEGEEDGIRLCHSDVKFLFGDVSTLYVKFVF